MRRREFVTLVGAALFTDQGSFATFAAINQKGKLDSCRIDLAEIAAVGC
jgi:hypothetical protein